MAISDGSKNIAHLANQILSGERKSKVRSLLLKVNGDDALVLTKTIRDRCYSLWTKEPAVIGNAASAIDEIVRLHPHREIKAIGFWVNGIQKVIEGDLEGSVDYLRESSKLLRSIGLILDSARTMVALLMVQAMLGRSNEALRTGKRALKIFLEYDDSLAAAKIELNLSNLYARSERHSEAERWGRSALARFRSIEEEEWEVLAENSLANTYTELNKLVLAESSLRTSLKNTRRLKMEHTAAEIEASLGYLLRRTGRYSEALRSLESSRKSFESFKIPHETAIALLEIGEAYGELNLLEEAREIITPAIGHFRRHRLLTEEIRARTDLGHIHFGLGDNARARRELKSAMELCRQLTNRAGSVLIASKLLEIEIVSNRAASAKTLSKAIKSSLRFIEVPRQKALAKFQIVRSEIAFGTTSNVLRKLADLRNEAQSLKDTRLQISILNETGRMYAETGSLKSAITAYSQSAAIVERLRSPLTGIEFRRSFVADKLEAFSKLVELFVDSNKIESAFENAERLRSRTLLEMLATENTETADDSRTPEANLLRQRLNWLYRLLDEAAQTDSRRILNDISRTERELSEYERRLVLERSESSGPKFEMLSEEQFDIGRLYEELGPGRCLIEYVSTQKGLGAFVLGAGSIDFVQLNTNTKKVLDLIRQFRFQLNAIRVMRAPNTAIRSELKRRIDGVLKQLHDQLIGPILHLSKADSLLISPAGVLNYVPFASLFNGSDYLVQKHSITLVPSAEIWSRLERKKRNTGQKAILFGSDDGSIPFAYEEIDKVSHPFKDPRSFTGDSASFSNFARFAPRADILHVVSHGNFRSDNPSYSSLKLSDQMVTAGDILRMKLRASLVTLSACETGLSRSIPGEELIGFTGSLLAAGARSLILSLWNVNDRATLEFMSIFYSEFARGASASQALRKTQITFAESNEHPYYWAPFVLTGAS